MGKKHLLGGVALALLAAATTPAAALTINLNDVGGVTGSPAEQGFKIAAKYWETVLVNAGTLTFDVAYAPLGPGILGQAGSSLSTYVPIANYYGALAATQTSAIDAQAVANLSPLSGTGSVAVTVPEYFDIANQLGVATSGSRIGPDNTALSATIALSTANVKAFTGGTTGTDAAITFSSNFDFDFDPTDGITAGYYDFIGVAVHEMGHALGFLSGAQDFDYSTGVPFPVDDYWWGYGADMFRYTAPGKLDWTFGSDSYFSLDGGATPYWGDAYWSTGAVNGDGYQASHWKAPGTCSNFIGIMNPYLCDGQLSAVSGLDLVVLDAIGWNLDAAASQGYLFTSADMYNAYFAVVPEPASWAMMIGGFALIGGAMRRQRKLAVVAA